MPTLRSRDPSWNVAALSRLYDFRPTDTPDERMTDLSDRYSVHVGPNGRVELECAPEPRFAFILTPSQARRLGTKIWKATGPWDEKDWRTMVLALRKIRDESNPTLALLRDSDA